MNKINVDKKVLLYFAEQLYVKAYSDGKNNKANVNIDTVVKKMAEQFANDVHNGSLVKFRL